MLNRTFVTAALAIGAAFLQPVCAQTPAKPAPKAAAAAATPAVLQTAASEIGFTTRQLGVPVEGKFTKFSASVTLDPKKPEAGNVLLSIDTGSARFGSPELDAEVPKATWLSAAKFPQATFQSTALKGLGGGKFEVTGKLSIKGQQRDVVVPVQVTQAGGTSTAVGSFTIKRLDFKVGEGEWTDTSMLANDIAVKFKLVLTGIAAL
ncbi:MAG: YceI family protein [Rubrivivax sp.]|jgi:polyisoprenoid-binding protein YceI